jgi:hypothetical protein
MPRPTSRLCKPWAQCCRRQCTTAPTCTDSMQLQSSTTSPCLPTSLKSPPASMSMHCWSTFLLCSLLAACWMAAHGSLTPTIRCGSTKCLTTVMVAAEEPKNRKGKFLISRAKLVATGSWQIGQQERILPLKRPQSYMGLLRSRNTQLCCKVGSGWYGGSDARGILWTALRTTWTGSAANQISLRHNARAGFFYRLYLFVWLSGIRVYRVPTAD